MSRATGPAPHTAALSAPVGAQPGPVGLAYPGGLSKEETDATEGGESRRHLHHDFHRPNPLPEPDLGQVVKVVKVVKVEIGLVRGWTFRRSSDRKGG